MAPSGDTRSWPLAGLGAGCVASLVGLYLVFIRTTTGQRLDGAAIEGRRLAGARGQEAADALLRTIDVSTLVLAIAGLALVAIVRRRPAAALIAAAAIAGAVLTTELLKSYVLPRPDLLLGGTAYDNSFPSGHATIAMAVGAAAIIVASPRLRRAVALATVLYGGAVGAATVALGWHRPSDVAGAFCVAIGWAALAALAAERLGLVWSAGRGSWPSPHFDRRVAQTGVAVLGAGYLVAIAIALASRLGSLELRLIDAAFVGATVSLLGIAAALVSLLVAALAASLGRAGAG